MARCPESDEWTSMPMLRDEALVLFEWLATNEETTIAALPDAQRTVLLWILGRLEETLVEPSMPDYRERVAAAGRRLVEMGVRPQSPSASSVDQLIAVPIRPKA